MTRRRRLVPPALTLAIVGLVAGGCSGAQPHDVNHSGDSAIKVNTAELRALKANSSIQACPSVDSGASAKTGGGLPNLILPCLGGGSAVDLASLRGPLVLNFWAQYCGPCRVEAPLLERLSRSSHGKVKVIGVDFLDPRPSLAIGFAMELGLTYPQIADPAGAAKGPLRISGLPFSFFVDATGRITYTRPGAILSQSELTSLVRDHLGVTVSGRKGVMTTGMPTWMRDIVAAVPQIEAHQLVNHRPPAGGAPAPRAASVLVLFGEGARGAELLLLERAADMRAHPGQVAFPGGSQDDTDTDAIAAALREAEEETGLDPSGVDIVGVLPALWLAATDYLVTPVIGWWRRPGQVHPVDPAETASVHVVPVDDLLDPAHRGRVRHPSGYVGPAFQVDEVLVWGFTALVLSGLFRELGWEREWDPEQYFDLPAAVLTGSQRDLARRRAAAGVATAEDRRA